MDKETKIKFIEIKKSILIIHKNNLTNAKTFEEYKQAHINYVQMLIDMYSDDIKELEKI